MTTARFRFLRWFDCCCWRGKIVLRKINNFISVQGCRCKLPKTFIIIAQFKPFLLCFIRNRIHFHFPFFWCFCSCSSFAVASIFVNCLLSNARGMRNYSRWASVELLLSSRDSISSLCTFFSFSVRLGKHARYENWNNNRISWMTSARLHCAASCISGDSPEKCFSRFAFSWMWKFWWVSCVCAGSWCRKLFLRFCVKVLFPSRVVGLVSVIMTRSHVRFEPNGN